MKNDMPLKLNVSESLKILTDIELNYQEFLEYSNSFLGWLLTLNASEFDYVYTNLNHDFKKDPENGKIFLFTQIEASKKGQESYLLTEVLDDLANKIIKSQAIKMVRESICTYKTSPKDEDWVFSSKLRKETDKEFKFLPIDKKSALG